MRVRCLMTLLAACPPVAYAFSHVVHTDCGRLTEWYYDSAHSGAQACCDRNATYPRALAHTPAEHATVVFHNKPRPIAWPNSTAFEVAWDHYNTTAVLRFPHVEDLAPFLNALLASAPSLFFPEMPSVLLYAAHDRTNFASLVPAWAVNAGIFLLEAP